jgi:hypothetical protein
MPLDAPTSVKPAITAIVESIRVARAVRAHPQAPRAKPTVITGVRPTLSIRRPAGTAVKPEDVRKIAGPSPSRPLTPVTSTKVSDETAAVNCRTAELTAIVAERITVLRRIGRPAGDPLVTVSFNQARIRQRLLQWRSCWACVRASPSESWR